MSRVNQLAKKIGELNWFDGDEATALVNGLTPEEVRAVCEGCTHVKSVERIRAMRAALKKVFVEKDQLIDLMAWATVAQLPMLLLGEWGTGKSYLVRSFARRMGLSSEGSRKRVDEQDAEMARLRGGQTSAPRSRRYFEYLVTRFTTPEELLGPVDVNLLLDHSTYSRQTRNLLPEAEIAFLDEVFKANSAILNALLSLINERIFYNAGQAWSAPLMMLFGASNEAPQEEELQAFYDRFPVRALCNPVPDDAVPRLLAQAHAQHCQDAEPAAGKPREAALASINDFRLLRRVSLHLFGGGGVDGGSANDQEFYRTYLKIFRHLRDDHDISDRSCSYYYRLARARALLDGRTQLEPQDCRVLAYCAKDRNAARHLPAEVDRLLC